MKDFKVLEKIKPKYEVMLSDAMDEAYNMGYNKGYEEGHRTGEIDGVMNVKLDELSYQRGLDDAWKYAAKAEYMLFNQPQYVNCFGDNDFYSLLTKMSASEVIAKIKEYEGKHKQTGEIKVGDEVVIDGTKGIIVREPYPIGFDKELFVMIWYGTYLSTNALRNVTFTGGHFPQIAEIMEQILKEV